MINDNEIKLDPHNYRIHGDENKRLINKSLTECGTGRSVLMDRENVMIAGNGVYEEAQKLGLKVGRQRANRNQAYRPFYER